MCLTGVGNMKATEKIKLMIDLEFGFKQLDLEELRMIKKVLEKEIDKKLPKVIQQRTRAIDGFGEQNSL